MFLTISGMPHLVSVVADVNIACQQAPPGWRDLTPAGKIEKERAESEVTEGEWGGGWGVPPLLSLLSHFSSSRFLLAPDWRTCSKASVNR